MKILLALNSSNLGEKRYCGFKTAYRGIPVEQEFAGRFGWFWLKALRQMGHEVEAVAISKAFVEIDHSSLEGWYKAFERRSGLRDLFDSQAGKCLAVKINEYKPDLVLVDGGNAIPASVIRHIAQDRNTVIVNWLLDDPWSQGWGNTIAALPFYDCIFTFDPYYARSYLSLGARRAEYLPCATDPDIYQSIGPKPLLCHELCFVGTVTQSRMQILEQLSDFNLHIWTWKYHSLPKKLRNSRYYRGKAFGEDINAIYNTSKIVLNFHHPQAIYGTNMRTFEVSSSGAFQLVDFRRELGNLFKLQEELVCYHDTGELMKLIGYYLANERQRCDIASRAQARCRKEHMFINRFEKMISVVEQIRKTKIS